MSVITDTWRQLVRRRLWPVALLLLGALVAVPVLLAKSPAPVAPPAPVAEASSADDGLAEPVVTTASTDPAATGRRHVLGTRKDPFKPAPAPKKKHSGTSTATTARTAGGSGGSGSSGGGGQLTSLPGGSSSNGGGGSSTPSTPSTTTPPSTSTPATPPSTAPAKPKKKTYPLWSVKVRFGDANSGTLEATRINKLDPLPDPEAPVVIYLGPGPDKRSAVFLVDASVTPEGDATCKPYDANCERIVMRKGDTEFFDVKDETGNVTATYELDLVDMVTKSKPKASATRAHRAGRAVRHALKADGGASVARAAGQLARVVAVLQPSL
jgi:hypothetical protein